MPGTSPHPRGRRHHSRRRHRAPGEDLHEHIPRELCVRPLKIVDNQQHGCCAPQLTQTTRQNSKARPRGVAPASSHRRPPHAPPNCACRPARTAVSQTARTATSWTAAADSPPQVTTAVPGVRAGPAEPGSSATRPSHTTSRPPEGPQPPSSPGQEHATTPSTQHGPASPPPAPARVSRHTTSCHLAHGPSKILRVTGAELRTKYPMQY